MCVEEQKSILEKYELQMLMRCKVPGLLPMEIIVTEQGYRYLYDISGKQQIVDYLTGQKLGCVCLQNLLFCLQGVCSRIQEYLLREDGICLDLEFIYVNLEDGSLQFTYLPFYEKNLPRAFQECMEQLLRMIDHKDQEAVELGYQVYQLCIQDNISIGNVLDNVLGKKQFQEEPLQLNREREQEVGVKCAKRAPEVEGTEENSYWQTREEKKFCNSSGFQQISKIREMVKEYLSKWKQKYGCLWINKKEKTRNPKITQIKEDNRNHKKMMQEQMDDGRKDGSLIQKVSARPTEILEVSENKPLGKLVYQGSRGCNDIDVEGEYFLLGKNSAQVNGVIDAEGVSRLHARITRQEEGYFIEDLNSTNGTFKNGLRMQPYEKRRLEKDDELRFGKVEYIFQ